MAKMITSGINKDNPKHKHLFEELTKIGCNPFYFFNPSTKKREIFYYDNQLNAKKIIEKYK